MKVLFVTEYYYPQTSGVPVVVKYLSEGLAAKGHNVSVVTQSCGNPQKEEMLNGVSIYRFDIYNNTLKWPCGEKQHFIDFVKDFHADATIIECTQCITTDLLLPYINKISGRKYFHVHGISGLVPDRKLFSIKKDFLHTVGNTYNYIRGIYYFGHKLKKSLRYFDATMCLSEVDDGIEYLRLYGPKNYILDNAADNIFFDEALSCNEKLSKYAIMENSQYMISCANYSYIKNQLGIIEQYYQTEASKEVSLVCIGSQNNDYYNRCKALVEEMEREYGHRDVKLLFGVERMDIPAILNKALLYLVGSRREQYSISIIEAMSQGVPFISTNVGNARILPGGITVDRIEDMHSGIDALVKDKERYVRISEAGKSFAYQRCRIDKAIEKLEMIITDK